MKKLILLCIVVAAAAALAPDAVAQGCSMCRKSVQALGPDGQRAMNTAILILLAPTLLLFGSVFYLARRKDSNREDV